MGHEFLRLNEPRDCTICSSCRNELLWEALSSISREVKSTGRQWTWCLDEDYQLLLKSCDRRGNGVTTTMPVHLDWVRLWLSELPVLVLCSGRLWFCKCSGLQDLQQSELNQRAFFMTLHYAVQWIQNQTGQNGLALYTCTSCCFTFAIYAQLKS